MAKGKGKGKGPNPGGPWRRLFYHATMMMLGDVPNPKASIAALREAVGTRMIELFPEDVDPEVPDNWRSLFAVWLELKGVTPRDRGPIVRAVMKASGLTRDGSLLDTFKDAEDEGIFDNIGDIVSELLSGDIAGALAEGGDLINDLFTGLFS